MPPARLALYGATLGLLVMTVRAVIVAPPTLGLAVLALVVYAALLLGGVFVKAPRGARGVALTFDDGPHPRWTRTVLERLATRGVRATFFVVGWKAEKYPEVVRAIVDAGHSLGLHSYGHDRLFALRGSRRVREDLERGIAVLETITGRRPVLFRPPIGHTNPTIARVADSLDLTVVGWSIAGRDGLASARPRDVIARVRRDLRDGAIVLLHDAPERGDREPAALAALSPILDAIEAEGLDPVPLSQWMDVDYEAAGSST
jgi:peptidoglycan-N-acetylglucosamine deacetylase